MKHATLEEASIALVYDKLLDAYGGAEHVLQQLLVTFPTATVYTSVYSNKTLSWMGSTPIHTTFLQKWGVVSKFYKLFAPVLPIAFENLDLSAYDIVISICSEHAKAVITKPHQLNICYLLTPTRYLHSHQQTYAATEPLLRLPGLSFIAQKGITYLRRVDQITAQRPDFLIPISQRIAARTKKYYHRETLAPLYPPAPYYHPQLLPVLSSLEYLLSASRLVAYKRIDLSVAAALTAGKRLIVAGQGPAQSNLIKQAGTSVIVRTANEPLGTFFARAVTSTKLIWFTNQVTESELAALFTNAQLFILPGIEDFGIAPLQAAHYGTPSILHHASGVSEILTEPFATHITEQTSDAVLIALESALKKKTHSRELKELAAEHLPKSFTTQFRKVVYDLFIKKGSNVPS